MIEFEDLDYCPVCQRVRFKYFASSPDMTSNPLGEVYKYYKCMYCFTVFLKNRPTEKSIHNFYQADYAPYILEPRSIESSNVFFLGANILDYGAGNKYFLKECNGAANLVAFDFDENLRMRFESDEIVFFSNLESLEAFALQIGGFDSIRLNHVIEHIHSPVELLRRLKGILRNGGGIFISTPNSCSLTFFVLRGLWRSLAAEAPRHLNLISPATIKIICKDLCLTQSSLKSEIITKDTARSLGYLLLKIGLIKKTAVEDLQHNRILNYFLKLPLLIFASLNKSDRFSVVLRK